MYIYYNDQKALEHETRLNCLIEKLETELISGNRNPEHKKQYVKYFEISTTPIRGTKATPKEKAITQTEKRLRLILF